ncbi:aspartic proteinase precursor [Coniophora puteana RWD-64-598 SS2]|uniref:Aspartic proteinase n=1 Tax=Coniophora puteana (strain RWD-64-598) TaxID=741705 RepID=A0A5M3N2T3_CONPW|nr:aspartic proteinase precursor [Coniophora puteana RWD-64-598 SS2]EIW85626.1 aspartic proteinase precursor [Coniophora puteana RWD-64-598 SS2]
MQYTVEVGVGNPPTFYNLLVDTGSGNTFVGTGKKYNRTETSIPLGFNVSVNSGSHSFSGAEYLDQVIIAPGVFLNQSIGVALSWSGFPEGVDGILGLGPTELTRGTVPSDPIGLIFSVMDTAVYQTKITNNILGISFAPSTNYTQYNGEIGYGDIDTELFNGDITYTPLTTTLPAAKYWGINIISSTYGTTPVFTESSAGIVDTGTTQVLLADDFFANYISAIPGAHIDNSTGLLVIPSSSVAGIEPLDFTIGGTSLTLSPDAQLIPQNRSAAWGGKPGVQYGAVGSLGRASGEGLDFVLGQKFLERYYAVFDRQNSRVGFAFTNNTFATYSTN